MKIYIGYDEREDLACFVARESLLATATGHYELAFIHQKQLQRAQLYQRPQSIKNEQLWDDISEAPMSTTHAIARFFVPFLSNEGHDWALFVDGDVMFRDDIAKLMTYVDYTKAVMVVQHKYNPLSRVKKRGDVQIPYARKNWSSVCLWNLKHPANQRLTLSMLNALPGRDLHRFCWLNDSEIGALPDRWNWLVRHSPSFRTDPDRAGFIVEVNPGIAHYTEGCPNIFGHQNDSYASEWFAYARRYPERSTRQTEHISQAL